MSSQLIIKGFDPEGAFAGMILPSCFRARQAETRFKQEWKIPRAIYLAMMNEFKGPKHQRGTLGIGRGAWIGAVAGGFVSLNTHSFTELSPSANGQCAVRFETNGNLVNQNLVSSDNTFTDEWYSETTTGIGSGFEVRALSTGKTGTWSSSGAADDIWVTISSVVEWNVSTTSGNFKATTATFEAGQDGVESALDSAAITCTSDSIA